MRNQIDFDARFAELTGHQPLSWQRRLHEKWATTSHIGQIIDLPTGLGKTMVMAIWPIARENRPNKIPTRLICVVDRRTVVDQATDLAHKLRSNFGKPQRRADDVSGACQARWSADSAVSGEGV